MVYCLSQWIPRVFGSKWHFCRDMFIVHVQGMQCFVFRHGHSQAGSRVLYKWIIGNFNGPKLAVLPARIGWQSNLATDQTPWVPRAHAILGIATVPWRCWIPSGTWQDCELQGAVPDQHWRKVCEGCLVQLNRLGSWNLNDLDVMMFKQYLSSWIPISIGFITRFNSAAPCARSVCLRQHWGLAPWLGAATEPRSVGQDWTFHKVALSGSITRTFHKRIVDLDRVAVEWHMSTQLNDSLQNSNQKIWCKPNEE